MAALGALLAVAAPATVHAAPVPQDPADPLDRFDRVAEGPVSSSFTPGALGGGGPVTVMLELAGDPVAVVETHRGQLTRDEKRALRAQRKAAQDQLTPAIRKLGGTVRSQVQSAYNGIKVSIDRADAPGLAALPGVKAVHAVTVFEPGNVTSVPYLGADRVWEDHGFTGEGVKVAVIDSGIDYTHATFAGPGTPEDFARAAAITSPSDGDAGWLAQWFGPDAPRVKGGYDFVGDEYDASDPASVPRPDFNPLDCSGHGTHVAGTAAGGGVTAGGAAYTGPYDRTTYDRDFLVGPGVAPGMDLYGLRIFGCGGPTDMTVEAIDWAVTHEMDVITMSLGAVYGTNNDPTSVAGTNAAATGIVVVGSAGNQGPNPYLAGSPGVADGVISVAAVDATATTELANPGVGAYAAFSSGGPRTGDAALTPSVSAPGVSIASAAVGTGTGGMVSSGTSMAAPHVAGAAALGIQAHPDRSGQDISAALVSTSDRDALGGYRVTRGGGLVDPRALVTADTFAYGDSANGNAAYRSTALNFGFAELAGDFTDTRTVTIVNDGPTARTFAVAAEPTDGSLPAEVSLGRDEVTVGPGDTATVKVTLSVAADDVPATAAGAGQHAFHEVSGDIVLTGDETTLHVGYLLVPRPATKVSASIRGSLNGPRTEATLVTSNMGAVAGGGADLYTWGLKDAKDQHVPGGFDLEAAGVQSFAAGPGNLLVFAVSTHDRHSNAAAVEFDVLLDTDRDGTDDLAVFSYDSGAVRMGFPDGVAEVFVIDLASGLLSGSGFQAVAPTDSSTVLLPVFDLTLGIDGPFDYTVASFHGDADWDRFDAHATYDATAKALSDGTRVWVPAGAKVESAVTKDRRAFAATQPLGLMAVAYDNPAGDEALLVPVR